MFVIWETYLLYYKSSSLFCFVLAQSLYNVSLSFSKWFFFNNLELD